MLNKLLCVFKGHKLEIAKYDRAMDSKSSPMITQDIFGKIEYIKPQSYGFLHFGLVSDCERCGKTIDVGDSGLPILMPKFDT
jgi:hypothetical protein